MVFAVSNALPVLSVSLLGYLDPGSGGILVYAIAGIVIALGYTLKRFGYQVYCYISGKRASGGFTGDIKADVIVHCEGPQYEAIFMPLLNELAKTDLDIAYVTQYPREEGFASLPESVRHVAVNDGMSGFVVLNKATARIFVTTTPQLDVMMFKRSKTVKHYVHVVHAPTDADTYEPFAFDHFDSIFCPADFMIKSIRHLESLRSLPAKKLNATGVLYYDSMIGDVQPKAEKDPSAKPTILIAPSWGPNSLFARYGVEVLDALAKDFKLIVRPHPQTKKSQEELYQSLAEACRRLEIQLDEASSSVESMNACDLMVSDFSGIIFDFSYLYEKPLIVMDTEMDYGGFEGHHLPEPLWRGQILSQLATVIKKDQFDTLADAIRQALDRDTKEIGAIRDANIANFGCAAPVARQQIQDILEELPED